MSAPGAALLAGPAVQRDVHLHGGRYRCARSRQPIGRAEAKRLCRAALRNGLPLHGGVTRSGRLALACGPNAAAFVRAALEA